MSSPSSSLPESSPLTAAAVEAALPRSFFVTRGDIQRAFFFSSWELAALIRAGVFVAKYPFGGAPHKEKRGRRTVVCGERARFVRSQVVAVAHQWEASAVRL